MIEEPDASATLTLPAAPGPVTQAPSGDPAAALPPSGTQALSPAAVEDRDALTLPAAPTPATAPPPTDAAEEPPRESEGEAGGLGQDPAAPLTLPEAPPAPASSAATVTFSRLGLPEPAAPPQEPEPAKPPAEPALILPEAPPAPAAPSEQDTPPSLHDEFPPEPAAGAGTLAAAAAPEGGAATGPVLVLPEAPPPPVADEGAAPVDDAAPETAPAPSSPEAPPTATTVTAGAGEPAWPLDEAPLTLPEPPPPASGSPVAEREREAVAAPAWPPMPDAPTWVAQDRGPADAAAAIDGLPRFSEAPAPTATQGQAAAGAWEPLPEPPAAGPATTVESPAPAVWAGPSQPPHAAPADPASSDSLLLPEAPPAEVAGSATLPVAAGVDAWREPAAAALADDVALPEAPPRASAAPEEAAAAAPEGGVAPTAEAEAPLAEAEAPTAKAAVPTAGGGAEDSGSSEAPPDDAARAAVATDQRPAAEDEIRPAPADGDEGVAAADPGLVMPEAPVAAAPAEPDAGLRSEGEAEWPVAAAPTSPPVVVDPLTEGAEGEADVSDPAASGTDVVAGPALPEPSPSDAAGAAEWPAAASPDDAGPAPDPAAAFDPPPRVAAWAAPWGPAPVDAEPGSESTTEVARPGPAEAGPAAWDVGRAVEVPSGGEVAPAALVLPEPPPRAAGAGWVEGPGPDDPAALAGPPAEAPRRRGWRRRRDSATAADASAEPSPTAPDAPDAPAPAAGDPTGTPAAAEAAGEPLWSSGDTVRLPADLLHPTAPAADAAEAIPAAPEGGRAPDVTPALSWPEAPLPADPASAASPLAPAAPAVPDDGGTVPPSERSASPDLSAPRADDPGGSAPAVDDAPPASAQSSLAPAASQEGARAAAETGPPSEGSLPPNLSAARAGDQGTWAPAVGTAPLGPSPAPPTGAGDPAGGPVAEAPAVPSQGVAPSEGADRPPAPAPAPDAGDAQPPGGVGGSSQVAEEVRSELAEAEAAADAEAPGDEGPTQPMASSNGPMLSAATLAFDPSDLPAAGAGPVPPPAAEGPADEGAGPLPAAESAPRAGSLPVAEALAGAGSSPAGRDPAGVGAGPAPGAVSTDSPGEGPPATAQTAVVAGAVPGGDAAPAPAGLATARRAWLGSYPPQVPETYRYPLVPLTRLLDDAAADFPDTEALDTGARGASLTFRQLLEGVDRCAAALGDLGVGAGDRVLLALPAWPQYVVALHAAWRLAAVPVALSPLTGEEGCGEAIAETGPVLALASDATLPGLGAVMANAPSPARLLATSEADAAASLLGRLRGRRRDTTAAGVQRWADVLAGASATATQVELDPRTQPAAILRSRSGRSVTLTHANLLAAAFQLRLWVPDVQAGRERVLLTAEPWTAFGLTAMLGLGLLAASTSVLPADHAHGGLGRTVARTRPTLAASDPATLGTLLAQSGRRADLTSIRVALAWGAPLPPDAARACEARTGGRVRAVYGPAEAAGLTHANPIYGKAKDGTVGLPVTDTDCRVADTANPDADAPTGVPGPLMVRGPQVAGSPDRWLPTGDTGAVDADGFLTIHS